MNATLNISVSDSTSSVTDTLQTAGAVVAALGLSSTLTPTLSTVAGSLEPGATVALFDVSPADVIRAWYGLKTTFILECCWIVVNDDGTETYAGCIKGWWAYGAFYPGPDGDPVILDGEEPILDRPKSRYHPDNLPLARGGTPLADRRWPADPNGPNGPTRSDYVRAAHSGRKEV